MTLNITVDNVRSVYSGRPGCCCGCRGKHTVNPAFRAEAEQARGYAVEDDECNAAVVKRHIATIQRHAAEGTADIKMRPDYVAAMTEGRWWIAYMA